MLAPVLTLDQLALDRGLASSEALARARLVQAETGERLESVLTRLGLVTEQKLAAVISDVTGLPMVDASAFPAEPIAAAQLSTRFLRDVKAVPLAQTEAGIDVALVNPLDAYPIEALEFAFQAPIFPKVARASDVEAALDRLYGNAPSAATLDDSADVADLERLKDLASDAPVIRAVNRLIAQAVELRASDIHVEPTEDSLAVRVRVDGALRDLEPLPAAMRAAFVSRVKVMAALNIAEKRLPQDGRMRVAVRGHEIDLRVATAPTIHGETVVLRLLDRSNLTLDFAALGFEGDALATFRRILSLPHGIVLVTGPTGSGKTTTLYTALTELNQPDRKILTVEDPIEYRLAGVNQTQVNPGIGLTFATALRSFLRQDPDVMMVGEIRDLETAQVAVQAALTGHTILSTLHTNTAAAAVTRLLDMGVEPFLITSTVNAVLAQRLVRRLCPHCREAFTPSVDMLEAVGLSSQIGKIKTLYHAKGCSECNGAGYRGRAAILELLVMDETLSHLVLERAEAREIHKAAVVSGMRPMLDDGLIKAQAGMTTLEEVLRVTRES
jgi:general secretion pathway protein E